MRRLRSFGAALMIVPLLTIPQPHVRAAEKAGSSAVEPDLSKVNDPAAWEVLNAQVEAKEVDGKQAVRLTVKEPRDRKTNRGSNTGVAYVRGLEFEEGVIELDLKGRSQPRQGSFLGVAFAGVDEKTYEGVYFRPFNFRGADEDARSHSVQYVSWPTHTWEKLRSESPGKYESTVKPVPDPDQWFHARIEVTAKLVKVFVNNAPDPSLVVDRLGDRKKGKVGIYADIYYGEFANLKITPKR